MAHTLNVMTSGCTNYIFVGKRQRRALAHPALTHLFGSMTDVKPKWGKYILFPVIILLLVLSKELNGLNDYKIVIRVCRTLHS